MIDEDRDVIEKLRSTKKKVKIIVALLIVAALSFCVLFTVFKLLPNHDGKIEVVTVHNVSETIEKSDMSTVKYKHNAVVTQKDKKGKDDAYYVAYEGTIKAGINLDKIKVDVDEQNKNIEITLPEAKITKAYVDESSLDYIFKKNGYNTDKVSASALKACQKDLREESKREDILIKAKEEAKNKIRALIEPWARGYTIVID